MLRLSRCTLFTLLFVGGCGAGTDSGGTGGTTQPTGGSTGGAKPVACTPGDTSNLVSASAFVCDANTPIQIQGSFYAYGDGLFAPLFVYQADPVLPCERRLLHDRHHGR